MVLGLLEMAISYRMHYFDCTKPTRVNEVKMQSICEDKETTPSKPETYTILQKRKHVRFKGYRCKVVKSTFLLYCGAFSHDKIAAVPKIEINQMIRHSECESLVTTNMYRSVEGGNHQVNLDEETVFWVNEWGQIHTDANKIWCQGQEMKVDGNLVQGMIQLAQYRIVIEKEEFIVEKKRVEATTTHVRLPKSCRMKSGGCITAAWTYVWNPPSNECPLVKVRETRLTKEKGYYVDHHLKLLFEVTETGQSPSSCTPTEIMYTNFESLYLSKVSDFEQLTEVDITIYTNMRDDYTMFQMEAMTNQVADNTEVGICKNKYQDDPSEIIKMSHGQFGRRNGDVIYIFRCQEKVGKIATVSNCGNKIPIENNLFVDPYTRIVTDHWAVRDCNTHYPMMVNSMDGWVTINPDVRPAKAPAEVQVVGGNISHHESMAHGGLYTRYEIESWESLIQYSQYRDAVSETLAYGVCVKEGKCKPTTQENVPRYNLQHLEEVILTDSIFDRIDDFVRRTGGYLSLIVIVMQSVKAIMWTTMIVLTFIKDGIQTTIALLYATCCPTPYTAERVRRRADKLRKSQEAMMDEESIMLKRI